MNAVRKAVLPVAGLGTRFLPATKAIPKEMLPLVDKPLIQYVVEEGVAAGIEEFILVTSQGKTALEDHFDSAPHLEGVLRARGEGHLLSSLEALKGRFTLCSVRQERPLGLGHAVLCARKLVGEEPFAVMLADDLIDSPEPVIGQLLEVHRARGGCVVAVMPVAREEVSRYGIIAPRDGAAPGDDLVAVADLVEKPRPSEAPSDLGIIGRYVFPPEVFGALEGTAPDARGEIQLTDGIRRLLGRTPVFGFRFRGRRYDAGNKLGFLQATVAFALRREDLGAEFRAFLRELRP